MALVLEDRVRETTTVVGTGDANLLGAVTGYQAFSVIGNTNTCYYTIADQGGPNWEVGIGTYSSTGPVLARTTVLSSNNSGNLVSFTAGTKDIFVTYPSEKAVYLDSSGNLSPAPVTISNQLNLTNASDYNLYASGAGSNYMAGSLGVGTTVLTARGLAVSSNITGNATGIGINSTTTMASDVTSLAVGVNSAVSTTAASYTLSSIQLFRAAQGTIGVGSTVTNQHGFRAESTLTGATNNYSFYGNLAAATGRYNLYMNGTADNYLAGSLGIGALPVAGTTVTIAKNLTGSTQVKGVWISAPILSDATVNAFGFATNLSTQAAAFTLPDLVHYYATQGSIGAGSAVTNQYGFYAESTLIGATNDFAFRGNLAAATGVWNLYMNGTANNYLAGSLGIGQTALTAISLGIAKNVTGAATAFGIYSQGVIQSDVTTRYDNFLSLTTTAAASFTLTDYYHYRAQSAALGASSAITNQYGFAAASGLTTATNNYGFHGNIAAATGRYNLYINGTADNYLAGNLAIGSTNSNPVGTSTALSLYGSATTSITLRANSATGGYLSTDGVNYVQMLAQASGASLVLGTNNTERMRITAAGNLGISGTGYAQVKVALSGSITGNINSYGYFANSTIASDVTGAGAYFATEAYTAASAFTLTNLRHFQATQATIGATSTVTNQFGFFVDNTLTGATNDYAFFGNLAAATGVWNLYMGGTANNYLSGGLGIGTTSIGGFNGTVQLSGSGSPTGGYLEGFASSMTAGSTVTTRFDCFAAFPATAAASFTISNVNGFLATQGSLGAGSTVTSYTGFLSFPITLGTNNFAFRGSIAAATGAWNVYMDGTANNYLAGSLGIGTTSLTGYSINVSKNATGATTVSQIAVAGAIQSDVTSQSRQYTSFLQTSGAVFTLGQAYHYYTQQGTFGSTTVSNQYGYLVGGSLTGATNNYGFYGDIAAATGRYNLYMAGTAANYLAGATEIASYLDITTNSTVGFGLRVRTPSGSASAAIIQFTNNPVTAQWATIASPASNVLTFNDGGGIERMRIDSVGSIGIGTASPNASALLDVQSTTKGVRMPNMTTTQKNAISSPAAGLMVFDTTLSKLCVYSGAAWQTITSV